MRNLQLWQNLQLILISLYVGISACQIWGVCDENTGKESNWAFSTRGRRIKSKFEFQNFAKMQSLDFPKWTVPHTLLSCKRMYQIGNYKADTTAPTVGQTDRCIDGRNDKAETINILDRAERRVW